MENSKLILDLEDKCKVQEMQIRSLKKQIDDLENELKSYPQLSKTYIGKSTKDGKITYRNWWTQTVSEYEGFCDNLWFSRYLRHKFPDVDYKLNFFSVFGEHLNIDKKMEGKKVFYTAEDMHNRFTEFTDKFGRYALNYVDFAMGYELLDNLNYLRFPYWITRNFSPIVTEEQIENEIEKLNSASYKKSEDVVVVCSHDRWKTRGLISDSISNFVNITYGGAWRNNTTDLWNKFNNNKLNFIKQFKFNICPENVISDGYVTEKIFESIRSDCIPLYMGGGNYLEPEILNKDAILLWDFSSDNSESVEIFKNLISDEKSYNEFKDQNPLLDDGAKFVINEFSKLEKHFERLIFG